MADTQYGTVENFLTCVDRGIDPHMADLKTAQDQGDRRREFFGEDRFVYDAAVDAYRQSLIDRSPITAPSPLTDCPPGFGNLDNYSGSFLDPTP